MAHDGDYSSVTDEELIRGCQNQDPEARESLYAHTADRIYRLLLRMTQNPDLAADLTQDTYIRVFENIDRFQGGSSLSTWIYRIAVNEARQHFRGRSRHEQILRDELPRPAESHAGGQYASAVALDVREALDRLPEEERSLIVLRYFEGLNYAQIADVLQKPPGTIASGLNRARRTLQAFFGPAGEEKQVKKSSGSSI